MPCRRTSIVSLPAPTSTLSPSFAVPFLVMNAPPGLEFGLDVSQGCTRQGAARPRARTQGATSGSSDRQTSGTTGTNACGICTRQPSPLRPMVPVKPEGLDHTGLHLPGRRR
jgi:hypothetical protein